ncbi:efflux RND transporter periplasmic adaptor subunit [Sphingomonas daechungensis]|uniref:efflux RND transporter periplasmic adaptor subunit n=1 Tax=Sphingomonas daechungensis TaxID=1176646 RepID=UPI003783A530
MHAIRRRILLAVPVAFALLAGCSQSDAQNQQKGPTQVGFVVVQRTAVPLQSQLGGRTVAFESSEVRPQVNGVIRRRYFTEGSYVRQGQPLYQIDPSLYRAAVNQAQANVAAARATLDAAQVRANRYKPLAEMEAISKQDYTDAAAQARQARASVAQNSAALDTARINLRYTSIPAPISGRIGRSLSTVGALVTANQADPLAVIQRLDPMYVDIQQSSADLTKLKRALSSGGVAPGSTQVRLKLEDGTDYGYTGTVEFSEVMVNESTGTVTLRARFPNPQGVLLPGMFVHALFTQAVDPSVFLVPQAALQRDIGGDAFVFVVGAGNKAERRKVNAERTFGENWVVSSGLNPGDKIITQGTANLRSGAALKPVPADTKQKIEPGKPGAGANGQGGRGG